MHSTTYMYYLILLHNNRSLDIGIIGMEGPDYYKSP